MDNTASLAGLKAEIQEKLGVPLADQLLSKNPALVRCLLWWLRGLASLRTQA